MKPENILKDGIEILNPYLNKNGFVFTFTKSGVGSGGVFSSGKYLKGNRTIELHYRYGLGLVDYSIDDNHLIHTDYMKLLGVYGKNHYPGFSDNPLQAFSDLLYDLRNFTNDFVTGDGNKFIEIAMELKTNPNMFKGFKGLSKP